MAADRQRSPQPPLQIPMGQARPAMAYRAGDELRALFLPVAGALRPTAAPQQRTGAGVHGEGAVCLSAKLPQGS